MFKPLGTQLQTDFLYFHITLKRSVHLTRLFYSVVPTADLV